MSSRIRNLTHPDKYPREVTSHCGTGTPLQSKQTCWLTRSANFPILSYIDFQAGWVPSSILQLPVWQPSPQDYIYHKHITSEAAHPTRCPSFWRHLPPSLTSATPRTPGLPSLLHLAPFPWWAGLTFRLKHTPHRVICTGFPTVPA